MAKQVFTTGQVLTAAQMTSLQQTAMLGGDASVKVASYTLVASDAGTTVAMNSASTTTITVNTGLFAAGDTVFIQNRGAGVCTVTAGTATVASAGSLALPQNDAGILYFTSASAATFYDFIQVGATSPLTTKGDLYGYSTSDARIPIGANGTVLTADSTESLGLKWATAAGGGGMTLINTGGTTLTGSSVTISSIPGTYKNLQLVVRNYKPATDDDGMAIRFNGDSNNRYTYSSSATITNDTFGESQIVIQSVQDNTVADGFCVTDIYDYANTSTWKCVFNNSWSNNATTSTNFNFARRMGIYNQTGAITEILIRSNSGNFTSGTAYLYGVS